MPIPKFNTQKELFDYLVENKSLLISEKKFEMKKADSVFFVEPAESIESKAKPSADSNQLKVKLVINTTKILDSHGDVHIDGIWNRSVKNSRLLYLLQEHKMSFQTIISDTVKASVEELPWKSVGVKADGTTQALVFEAIIDKDRNEYMFSQYLKGHVKNHSVGMQYIDIELAINSDDNSLKAEKRIWDKYIDQVVNRKDAEDKGYFWAVTEAKIIEGSAVPMGSNTATPTLDVSDSSAGTPKNHISDPADATLESKKRLLI
jgi:hypothetical protein